MARPKSKPTATDLLALGELQTALRQAAPLLRRLKARQCLKYLLPLRKAVRQAIRFRAGMPGSAEARVVLLDEALFQEHMRPRLHTPCASLAEYQAKRPEVTHGLFVGDRLLKLGRES